LTGWDEQRFNSAFDFLLVSEQTNRWPLVEKLGRRLLAQPALDIKRRIALQTTLMESLARQARGTEAMQLMDDALAAAGRVPGLRATVLLKAADLQWNHLQDFSKAAQIYEGIVQDHRNLDHPAVREAAIHWGDLLTQAGDLVPAAERYRLAKSLGGERFAATGQSEAIQRGALLRITEQKLRSGDVRGTRRLLDRIELEFPEQKLEGLYRFLRAEADRFAGRYEDAARHYEVLLRLRQWAGFRDRAMHGMADCALRQEDFAGARAWLDKLRENFPDYFTQQKLAPIFEVVTARATRAATPTAGADPASTGAFRGHATGFEPAEPPAGHFDRVAFVPALGMDGPTVASGRFSFTKDLRNIQPDSTCWVEFWYRKQGNTSLEPYQYCYVNVWIYSGADGPATNPSGHVIVPLDRASYGQWRKAATRIKTPLAPDALIKIELINITGTVQIDGLKILPVTDRQTDSLRSFIEVEETEP
jgi:tetratricopeptide (TPR) repeat protein